MSQASMPSRRLESDNQSNHSSHNQRPRGDSSPTQNEPQKQSVTVSHVEHSEGSVRKRIQRSTSSSSTSSGSSNFPTNTSKNVHQRNSHDKIQFQTVSTGKGAYSTVSQNAVSGERRKGRVRKEVIPLPDQPGQVRQVRRRMPTPEPDTLERVYIQRTAPEMVEEITEIPMTPPPIVKEQTVVEPSGPPQVIKRTIRVPPRGSHIAGQQQAGANVQYNGNLSSTGGYNVSQQQAPQAFPGGFSGATNFAGGYQSFGGNLQQQAPIVFSVGGPGCQSSAMPPIGCQPAFCFYI